MHATVWPIKTIFGGDKNSTRYKVPIYQRGYAWKDTNIQEFCDDLWEQKSIQSDNYHFGTIYTQRKPGDDIKIIDGQQRITTCAIFLCVIRDWIDEFSPGNEIADKIDERLYIFNKKIRSIDYEDPVLSLGRLNNSYFHKCILKRQKYEEKKSNLKVTENDSSDNIKNAYENIREIIIEKMKDYPNNSKLEHIEDLIYTMLEFELIDIEIEDTSSVYKMFHRINNRGLQLAESDFIKNIIFEKLDNELDHSGHSDKLEKMNEYDQTWTELRNRITDESKSDYDFSNFLYHYLVVHFEKEVKKSYIHTNVEDWIKNASPHNILDTLSEWGKEFQHLRVSDEYFKKRPHVKYYLKKIKELKYVVIYPLIIAAFEKFDSKNNAMFERIVEIAFKYHLRNKLIGGARATPFEAPLKKTARSIHSEKFSTLDEIIKSLTSDANVHIPEDQLKSKLLTFSTTDSNVASALLQEIERKRVPAKQPGDDASIEHIMPRSKTKWIEYIRDKHKEIRTDDDVKEFHSEFRKRLGNQTLVRDIDNKRLSNKSFDDKKSKYAKCGYKITEEISELDEWTKDQINTRQKSYADDLLEILRIENIDRI